MQLRKLLKNKKFILLLIFTILLGVVIGRAVQYYSIDKCEIINQEKTACIAGCGYSELPSQRQYTCELFCNQTYSTEDINGKTICHSWQKYLR